MTDLFDQTERVVARGRKPLPERYYLTHFNELLQFVREHYGHVLGSDAEAFLSLFRDLSRDGQCLYARLVGRRGRVFRTATLRYAEIGSVREAVAELTAAGLVSVPDEGHLEDLLTLLTAAELRDWLRGHIPGVARSLRKADYTAMVRDYCDPSVFVASAAGDAILARRYAATIRFLSFLYFGESRPGLGAFTMRDLGLIRARRPDGDYEPRFADIDEAQSAYFFAAALADLARGADVAAPATWPEVVGPHAARSRDKYALRAGRAAEKADDPAVALAAYQAGETGDCLSSAVRLLIARGDRDEAERCIRGALDAPRSDEERVVATDLLARKFGGRRTSAATETLRDADVIDADQSLLGCPEEAVVSHFERQGIPARRVENRVWRALFGLVFWDELAAVAAHSPFDRLPAALADGTFADRHADAVAARLASAADTDALVRKVTRVAVRSYGTDIGIFRWRRDTLAEVVELIRYAPPGAITTILAAMARDFRALRHGWPDLMLRVGERIELVEVKAEGDTIRRAQWQRLELLRQAGFAARIVRVRWTVDPQQTFVVVDVETTGGRGEDHRITEFGAVRVRNGEVIDRYESLLHPQRAIPPAISRLTGITEAMVASAPTFADEADRIAGFLDGAIFVAHNVAFDYRFVRSEFARLGRRFRAPKLCTCAGMRRFYPGLRSYSLRALCDEFQIPLRSHHRALCDAEAAAELLHLINDKRAELVAAAAC